MIIDVPRPIPPEASTPQIDTTPLTQAFLYFASFSKIDLNAQGASDKSSDQATQSSTRHIIISDLNSSSLQGITPDGATEKSILTEPTPQQLRERLEEVISSAPEFPHPESIGHVRQFIQFVEENGNQRKPYRFFTTAADFKLYYDLHPEWQGKSIYNMQHDNVYGGQAFYAYFSKWLNKHSKDKKEQLELRNSVIRSTRNQWHAFNVINDWVEEFNKHPEWAVETSDDLRNSEHADARAFYQAFKRWIAKTARGDNKKRRELFEQVVKLKTQDWILFTTLEEWENEFKKHPEWQGKSRKEMEDDTLSGASAFTSAFSKWAIKEIQDKKERTFAYKKLFEEKKRHTKWNYFTTINDWVEEFNKHPEWKNLTASQMVKNTQSGAQAFYLAFSRWVKKTAKNKQERMALMGNIINRHSNSWTELTTIESWMAEFNKHPEWKEKSPRVLYLDKEASSFYSAFYQWVRQNAQSDEESIAYKTLMFPNFTVRNRPQQKDIKSDVSQEEALRIIDKFFE